MLLELDGRQVEADGPSGLNAGRQLRLRVDQIHPQVLLHIMEVESTLGAEAAKLLRSHLPAHADAGELLEHLVSLIDTNNQNPLAAPALAKLKQTLATLLSDGKPPDAERLKSLLQDGGVYYEAKLLPTAKEDLQRLPEIADGDLKGLLLSALKENGAGISSTALKNAISGQLNNIETQRAVNLLAQLDRGLFQFQIPFFYRRGILHGGAFGGTRWQTRDRVG